MGRRPDPNRTRANEIIRATIRCLARSGFSQLTMKRLSEEAGISQGILHYYFKDKRAILAAAAEHVMDDLDLRAKSEFKNARDPKDQLRGMIKACLTVATVDREFWTVFMALWGESLHDPALALLNKKTYRRAREVNRRNYRKGYCARRFQIRERASGQRPYPCLDRWNFSAAHLREEAHVAWRSAASLRDPVAEASDLCRTKSVGGCRLIGRRFGKVDDASK